MIFLTSSRDHTLESFDVYPLHYIIRQDTKRERFEEIFIKAVSLIKDFQKESYCLQLLFTDRSSEEATAQESSPSAREMSSQAHLLKGLVVQFKFKKGTSSAPEATGASDRNSTEESYHRY